MSSSGAAPNAPVSEPSAAAPGAAAEPPGPQPESANGANAAESAPAKPVATGPATTADAEPGDTTPATTADADADAGPGDTRPATATDARTAGTAPDVRTAGTAPDARTAGTAPDARTAGTAPDARTAGTAPGEITIPASPLAEAKEAAARSKTFRTRAAEPAATPPDPAPPKPAAPRGAGIESPGPGAAKPTEAGTATTTAETTAGGSATPPGQPTRTGNDIDLDKPVVVTVGSASGGRVTRVLRHANPVRAARTAGRSTQAWARRPAGRLIIPAVIAVLLLGAAGTAGAYLVPQALEAAPSPSATPGFPLEGAAPGPSGAASLPVAPSMQSPGPPVTGPGGVGGARPADALAGWAQQVGTRVGIPVVAVQAYGYAELVAARTAPSCRLSWTTIAAIAKVESAHGSANGAVLGADGSVQPPVLGLPLDGKGGRQLIRDTDQGTLDGDTTLDRAVGPLQFIPATWNEVKVDADNNGTTDPNDIDDASVAAALYLCRGGRDMSRAASWWDGILSYNAVQPYAQKVFDAANEYGRRSRV